MSAANRTRARDGTASVAPEPPAARYLRPPPSLRRYWRRAPAPALWAWELRRHKRKSFDGPDCGSKSPVPPAAITAGKVSRGLLIDPGTEPNQTLACRRSLKLHRLPAIRSPGERHNAITFAFPGSAKLVLHGALHAGTHDVLRALSDAQRRLISIFRSPESVQSLGRRWNLKAGRGQFRTQRRLGRNRRGELALCRIESERAAYADQCSGRRRHDKGPRIEHDHGFGKTLNVDAIRSVV